MSKEREMIEKLCSFQMTYSDWLLLIADAEELLAQPEQEPLTREEISQGFRDNEDALNAESYWAGVKYAEKMHGIGGEPLSNEQKRLEAIAIKQREAHGFGGGE